MPFTAFMFHWTGGRPLVSPLALTNEVLTYKVLNDRQCELYASSEFNEPSQVWLSSTFPTGPLRQAKGFSCGAHCCYCSLHFSCSLCAVDTCP